LQAARCADAGDGPHEKPEVESADVDEESFQDGHLCDAY
jgi:hypothetical protein